MRFETDTVVWLIRHGASTFNAEKRCQGCYDGTGLTESGRADSRTSGVRLYGSGIDSVISSPLRRTRQTADEVIRVLCRHQHVGFEVDTRLREIELPQWEGLPISEIPRRFSQQFSTWRTGPADMAMRGADGLIRFPVRDLYLRARRFWRDVLAKFSGRSILLVTHGGTGRALIATALGLEENHFHALQQSNCGVSRLRFSGGENNAQVELLNDTSHLAHRLPKLKEGRTGVQFLLIPTTGLPSDRAERLSEAFERTAVHRVFVAGSTARRLGSAMFRGRYIEQMSEESLATSIGRMREHGNDLRRLVLIAPPNCLRQILCDQIGWKPGVINSLLLRQPGVTAVHCPPGRLSPILQAMNVFEPRFAFTRDQV